jgi:hypothetical protein
MSTKALLLAMWRGLRASSIWISCKTVDTLHCALMAVSLLYARRSISPESYAAFLFNLQMTSHFFRSV